VLHISGHDLDRWGHVRNTSWP